MDPKDFPSTRTGIVRKNEFDEWTFVPSVQYPTLELKPNLISLLANAERALGAWSGICAFPGLFDISLYIGPMVRLEATLSSKIEGTRTTFRDLLLMESAPQQVVATPDLRLVHNLSEATIYGWERIKRNPIDTVLLDGLHKRLLQGFAGDQLEPGILRAGQAYVTSPGQTREEASYVPPSADLLPRLMKNLDALISQPSDLPVLLRIGIVHFLFEAIHPYADGNGRVGRLLIMLLLSKWGLLPFPILNLSKYFLQRRQEYTLHLLRVSQRGEWEEWLEYFLTGIQEQSEISVQTVRSLGDLRSRWKKGIVRPRMPARLPEVVDLLFRRPIINVQNVADDLSVTFAEASRLVSELEQKGILIERTGRKRDRVFEAAEVLEVFTKIERIQEVRPITPPRKEK